MSESATLGYWFKFACRYLDETDARFLCESAFDVDYTALIANTDHKVPTNKAAKLQCYVKRRCGGEPIAYIVGFQGFWRHEFEVSPATLIPRPETETLVECVLNSLSPGASVLDLGTGSGAIGLSIAASTRANVTLVDASCEALKIAERNARRLNATAKILKSIWYENVDRKFDCIASNPPYIASTDPHLQQGDLRYEPLTALDGGEDGLDGLREVVNGAPTHLKPKGHLAVEHGYNQANAVADLFSANGFIGIDHIKDLTGHARVTHGHMP